MDVNSINLIRQVTSTAKAINNRDTYSSAVHFIRAVNTGAVFISIVMLSLGVVKNTTVAKH